MSPLAARLEGLGAPPTEDELEHLIEPQRDWWNDRDRIVLLYEYVESQDDNFEKYFEDHGAKALMVRPPLPFRSFPPSQPFITSCEPGGHRGPRMSSMDGWDRELAQYRCHSCWLSVPHVSSFMPKMHALADGPGALLVRLEAGC
jgi:hypothetical protein